jgi:hypothetical protein
VRHLAVPDLTTTVLTMTLTGIAADIRSAGRPVITRRLFAVATMFLGALLGGLLVLNLQLVWARSRRCHSRRCQYCSRSWSWC